MGVLVGVAVGVCIFFEVYQLKLRKILNLKQWKELTHGKNAK